MDAVSLYLEKFKNLVPVDDALKGLLLEIIKTETGITLEKKALAIDKWTVRIQAPAAIRSEIYLHREQILDSLLERLGHQGPKQIV